MRIVQQQIQHLQELNSEFIFHKQAALWTQIGDRANGNFFRCKGPHNAKTLVTHLRQEDGSISWDPVEMRNIATRFYNTLLEAEKDSEEARECRNKVWDKIQPKISKEMNDLLLAPMTEEELREALQALPRNSCPGLDGLSSAFFLEYWDVIKTDLCEAFNNIFQRGYMPESFTEGFIYMIPKGEGPSDDMRKWRPITILNTVYKIYAKAWSVRIQAVLPLVIHPSQTGFIKERSILDNIFTFWEMSAVASKTNQDLAVILLDFEKAYDRVDWMFLEGTLQRFGFSENWIKGMAALYRMAHSRVMLAGEYGPRFRIERSVRQGCPLAPFLFLFVAEAMHVFLTSQEAGLQGIRLPITLHELVDVEFADDTALYMHGSLQNLKRLELGLQTFCKASGAKINWNKSMALWISKGPPPQWMPHQDFRWIQRGIGVRYLGCQIGVDLPAKLQIAPMLLTIKKKLLFWSSAKLSFAGRVVVVNHVILSTLWYIASCWIFSRACIGQLRRLIRNFLWSGREGTSAAAKVSWEVISLPTKQGGLGIIDPLDQSRALLAKLVVRGFMPGQECWKELFLRRCYECAPRNGAPWPDEARWIFAKDFHLPSSRKWEDRFINGIFAAWAYVKKGLCRKMPTTEDEVARQPIIWNANITLLNGQMIGSQPKLAWGKLAAGPGRSLGDWKAFINLPDVLQENQISRMYGGMTMYHQVQQVVHNTVFHLTDTIVTEWYGAFTRNGVLIAVRGISADRKCLFYEIGPIGQLCKVEIECELVQQTILKRVRIVGYDGKKWYVDPRLEDINNYWKLWVYGLRPLIRLSWDPGEYTWQDPLDRSSKSYAFFQYSVKLGRRILSAQRCITPAAMRHWMHYGLSLEFLQQFWETLWKRQQAQAITHFQWLLVHKALPVGLWLQKMGYDPACKGCGFPMESQKHCLWDCTLAQSVWKRVLRIVAYVFTQCTLSWGMAMWSTLQPMVLSYELESVDKVICLTRGTLSLVPMQQIVDVRYVKEMQPLWEILSSTTIWHIWNGHCALVLDNRATDNVVFVREIWFDIVLTLRG